MAGEIEITKARPYNQSEFWDRDKRYNIQNMLLCQQNFPAKCCDDEICSTYQDRDFESWDKAIDWLRKTLRKKEGKDYCLDFHILDPKLTKKFVAKFLSGWLKRIKRKLTGYRIIRYTNVASGYPCILVMGFSQNPKNPKVELYSGQVAPNVEGIERQGTNFIEFED